jgi:predicted transcriptional regulator
MTMLSVRVEDADAAALTSWASRLGIDRSSLLREAIRHHLGRLAAEDDSERWQAIPLDDGEQALRSIAAWGPAEDWADWVDAAR